MKTHHSTCGWFAIAIILAMTLAVSPSCPATSAEAGGSSSPERAQAVAAPVGLTESEQRARRAWRAEMSKRPVPKNGCYHAAYPDTEWREVQCGRPSPVPNQPRKGGGANIVGNGADYAAKTSGLISSVTGSFLSSYKLGRRKRGRGLYNDPAQLASFSQQRLYVADQYASQFPHGRERVFHSGLQRTRRMLWLAAVHPLSDPGARADRNAGIGGAWRQPPAFLPYGPCYRSMHPGR